jgi:hypothetical protein
VQDLLLSAKHLFVAAMVAIVLAANSEAALRARRGLAVLQGDWLHRTNLWRKRTNPRTGSKRLSGIGLKMMWEKQHVVELALDLVQAA